MKKIVNYCDICEENFEAKKCKMCNSLLCSDCSFNFIISIGDLKASCSPFCSKCLAKLQFNDTKKDKEFIKRIRKEIVEKLNEKIKKVK